MKISAKPSMEPAEVTAQSRLIDGCDPTLILSDLPGALHVAIPGELELMRLYFADLIEKGHKGGRE